MSSDNKVEKKRLDVEVSTRKLQTFTRKLKSKGNLLAEELFETTVKEPINNQSENPAVKDEE